MMEVLLLGGLAYFLYRKFRSPAVASGFGTMQYRNSQPYTQYTTSQEAPVANNDIDYRSLMLMDRSFDPDRFLKRRRTSSSKSKARGISKIPPY